MRYNNITSFTHTKTYVRTHPDFTLNIRLIVFHTNRGMMKPSVAEAVKHDVSLVSQLPLKPVVLHLGAAKCWRGIFEKPSGNQRHWGLGKVLGMKNDSYKV